MASEARANASELVVEAVMTGGNGTPGAVCGSPCGALVAYAAGPAVAVWPRGGGVEATLTFPSKHAARVTAVVCPDASTVIAGNAAGVVFGWRWSPEKRVWRAALRKALYVAAGKKDAKPVAALAVGGTTTRRLVAATDAGGALVVWEVPASGSTGWPEVCRTTAAVSALAISLAVCNVGERVLVAAGRVDARLGLYLVADGALIALPPLVGHEDWVSSLAWHGPSGLLASGSQDARIRVWRLELGDEAVPAKSVGAAVLEAVIGEQVLRIRLESVLAGHDGWVTGLAWQPGPELVLASASMDKSVALWGPPASAAGVWATLCRMGELGGNTLGMLHHGALHAWEVADVAAPVPVPTPSGHSGSVTDASWTPDGKFVVSVSKDQTTRWFGRVTSACGAWHEVGRPQIHGFDLTAAVVVPHTAYTLVSGAEEKIPRVFRAPRTFLAGLNRLCGTELAIDDQLPLGANVPALGLSNKAVVDGGESACADAGNFESEMPVPFAAVEVGDPPLEEHLIQNTLWPEVHKLYGHGYEVYSLATSPCGRLVASSSKASSASAAGIRLWSTSSWREACEPVSGHKLTVVAMAWSADGKVLVSASRDRTFAVHDVDVADDGSAAVSTRMVVSAHARIIWDVALCPTGARLATASRDKTVKLWSLTDGSLLATVVKASAPATAVAFSPLGELVVGLETGKLTCYREDESGAWSEAWSAPKLTGLPQEQAAAYLDMAGGSVEAAYALYASMLEPAGGGSDGGGGGDGGDLPFAKLPFRSLVWPDGTTELPEAWLVQGFALEAPGRGMVQPKNGPCGLVAAVLAGVVANKLAGVVAGTQAAVEDWTDAEALAAVAQIVVQARTDDSAPVHVARWAGEVGEAIECDQVSADEVAATLVQAAEAWLGAGGALLLLYSLVATRGEAQVRADIAADAGEPPLIVGPAHLCSMELLSLVVRGSASGNVTAFHPLSRAPADWTVPLGFGLLSKSELEMGVPVADSLKSPRLPVWILHGGDHFTTAWLDVATFAAMPEAADCVPPVGEDAPVPFNLVHWNGLPPAGPRRAVVRLTPRTTGRAVAGKAPKELRDSYVKKVPGEIDSIVQAHPDDKKNAPDAWNTWRYEVVLAVDEPDVEGVEPNPNATPPPTFDLGEPPVDTAWRCASCYRGRYKTFCFGLNEAGATACRHCDKPMADAGWSLWMPYDDLPGSQQSTATNRHAPNIYIVLRRRWPGAKVAMVDEDEAARWPSV
ncbi:uncharacterized protein AMSG_12072 [Thecamonas trahens ATCC 50062]|uniref:Elongator complex protein 2 n=1 Tax=Thecamonas trahens ATCC 50062 TaxID=461836 RepID=A0A0L0DGW9_THETB|nr:hypothetical protein AMSG_12072 [Thecamonas trahens ATCC 50062]KNC51579.1 hypothetical protein AMSG_12072 [Thecamonas trahens ATCC 50062]|eukprot:XP_013756036.1 hypothetical protein AMSG_12072 [Thecamonas trahens ATCC 50062]